MRQHIPAKINTNQCVIGILLTFNTKLWKKMKSF